MSGWPKNPIEIRALLPSTMGQNLQSEGMSQRTSLSPQSPAVPVWSALPTAQWVPWPHLQPHFKTQPY